MTHSSLNYWTEKVGELIRAGDYKAAEKIADHCLAIAEADVEQSLSLQRAVAAAKLRAEREEKFDLV